jgi:hypothetical protein
MTEIHLLLLLLLVHVLADFYLQPLDWVQDRDRLHARSPKLRQHVALHMAGSFAVILWWQHSYGWSSQTQQALVLTVLIGLSHFAIDVLKSYFAGSCRAFVLDQLAHGGVLLLLWSSYCNQWQWLESPLWSAPAVWLSVLIYLLVLQPTSFLVSLVLDKICPRTGAGSGGLQAAGHLIGMLERSLIVSFVLMDELAAVGFLLAAKSIFRFGDLQNRQQLQLTEYVLLGTLLSCGLSVLAGLALRQLW